MLFRSGRGADNRKVMASNWLRENPHRVHLGIVGLQILKSDGTEISIKDIKDPVQKLDLWTGMIESRFNIEGVPVIVNTVCHPGTDMIAVKVNSDLVAQKRLKIRIHFPLGVSGQTGFDFTRPGLHTTTMLSEGDNMTLFERIQDEDRYFVRASHRNSLMVRGEDHMFFIEPAVSEIGRASCRERV